MKILITEKQVEILLEQAPIKDPIGQFLDELSSIDSLSVTKKDFKYDGQVRILQIALSFLGFDLPKYGIDGKFGPETLKSLNAFQEKNNIPVSTTADKNVFSLLTKLIKNSANKSDLSHLIKGTLDVKPSKVNVGKKNVGKQIVDFLVAKGLTPEQASGIAGNLYKESSFNPTIHGDNGTSYGLVQWHNERKTNLFKWGRDNNSDPTSVKGQLDFLWYELTKGGYGNVLTLLKNSETPSEAAAVFAKHFEKPKSADYSQRAGAAEDIFSYVSGDNKIDFYTT